MDDLPLFADDKNKQLHTATKAKESRLEHVEVEIKENSSRVAIMNEHLKNVKQELLHTQQLVEAKAKELQSEEHLRQLSLREVGRLRQELGKLDTQINETQDGLNVAQNFIFKGNEKMDKFKQQMNWNQEEMEQWALATKQKEEDNLALQKYTRADEVKIKELTLEAEKLAKTLQSKKYELENEATETHAKQIELDKAADEFKTLHKDRQQLVEQWQDTIEAMKRRDADIARAGQEFAALRAQLEEQKTILRENKQRMQHHEQDNVETQSKIAAKERQLSKVRQELQDASGKLQEFRDEVEIMKNELASAAAQLMQKRTQNSNRTAELEEKKLELDKDRARYKATKKKLELFKSSTVDAETIAQEAEEDMTKKEAIQKSLEKDIGHLKDVIFRQSQELFNHRQEEANMIAEISGAQAAGRNLQTKIKLLDTEAIRQQELVYNGEFQIQQMERKVARASGERSADETKALKAEIDVLQSQLDQVKTQFSMLETQCKKVDDEFRRQCRAKADSIKESQVLTGKIAEVELENESSTLTLQKALKAKENMLVKHDVLKLEIKRLKDILNAKADEVYTLENRKFQLQMSMEERKKEIEVHRDVQRAQLKAAEEERHRVAREFSERRMHVEKLQAKYETLCKSANIGDDDEGAPGEEKSQAYFVIKAAQRREELQRQGDELDDKIRIAERELKALSKTLSHLAVRNTEYRKSFHRADTTSDEAQKLNQLEDQNETSTDALFKRKKELQRLQTEFESDSKRLDHIRSQSDHILEHADHMSSAYQQVVQDVNTQKEKLQRARKRVNRLIKKHRTAQKASHETVEEVAFKTYTTKEITGNLLYTLGQLANEFPEISDDLHLSLKDKKFHIPTRPQSRMSTTLQSRGSVRPLSARSDRSDASSMSTESDCSTLSNLSTGSQQTRQAVEVQQVQLKL